MATFLVWRRDAPMMLPQWENRMLAVPSSGASDQAAQRARLKQFLISVIPIVFCFGLLYGGIGVVFGDLPTMINSAILFAYGFLEVIAWVQFHRDHMQTA